MRDYACRQWLKIMVLRLLQLLTEEKKRTDRKLCLARVTGEALGERKTV